MNSQGRSRVLPVLRLLLAVALAGCGLPKDVDSTLERVRGGTLRVGVVERPPFTRVENGVPAGPEVELVQELAQRMGATVEWSVGVEARLMEAVSQLQLFDVPEEEPQRSQWAGPPLARLAWLALRFGRTELLARQLPG